MSGLSLSGRRRWFEYLGTAAGLLLLAFALYGLHHTVHGFNWQAFLRQAGALSAWQLVWALLLTAASYLVLTTYDIMAFRYIRHPIPYARIAFASFIGYAFSNNVGLGVLTGGSVRYRLYSAWGLSAVEITKVVAFCSFTFAIGTLAIMGTVFALEPIAVAGMARPTVRALGVLMLLLLALYLVYNGLRTAPVRFRGWQFRLPGLGMSLSQVFVCTFDLVLTGSVLYMLLPASAQVPYLAFIGVFLIANVLGHVSQVPGGLGVFESTIVYLLSDAIQPHAVLSALLLFRAVYHILPLLVGMLLLAAYEILHKRERLRKAFKGLGGWSPGVMPHVLNLAGFVAGAVLLFSGAVPPVESRLLMLRGIVPLPIIELAHFLGSVAGMALIMISQGLERRLAQAYRLTVGLIGAGLALSLLRGLHYEEALVLAIILAVFLPSQKYFHRRASILSGRLTAEWIATVTIVFLASIFLGIFSFRNVAYNPSLWWKFSVLGDASRFLRASFGALLVAVGMAVARLLREREPLPGPATPEDLARAARIATLTERAEPALALTGDKRLLFGDDGESFVMFAVARNCAVALGDPVGASPQAAAELVWRFRQICDDNDLLPAFYEVESAALSRYLDVGLTLLALGEDAAVDLIAFSTQKSVLHDVLAERAKLEAQGTVFGAGGAVRPEELQALMDGDAIRRGFSFGRLTPEYLARCVLVTARRAGTLVGFATVLESPRKREAMLDLLGTAPGEDRALVRCLMLECALAEKERGAATLSLGMAPLPGMQSRSFGMLWHRIGSVLYGHGEEIYGLKGLRRDKEPFEPRWVPKYLASPGGLQLPRILAEIARLIRNPDVPPR